MGREGHSSSREVLFSETVRPSVNLTKMDDYEEYDRNMNDDDDIEAIPDDEEEITQEDAWAVISAYFEEKGLVRQQLDSFDEFIQNTMQEIVDESADIEIRPESQHNPGHQSDVAEVRFPDNFFMERAVPRALFLVASTSRIYEF